MGLSVNTLGARLTALSIVVGLAGMLAPNQAAACGGCFAPQGSPTVVTRHQMAVSLTMEQTTLWDQIEYAGAPEDFVWVLPVRGGVPVELADNAFFEALEAGTQIVLQAPLPPRTFCSDPCGGSFAGAADSSGRGFSDAGVAPVEVYHQATIGPYETVTIGSEDPEALVNWLRDRDYTVPDAILPTIRHYTDLDMNFAVLRLAPGEGVNQMVPVRVSMPGLNPVFPLRMVAAGVEGSVGLELFVFSEGRYQPDNFGSEEVDRDAVTYDWATGQFDYDLRYEEAASRNGGRSWVTEFAGAAPDSIAWYRSYDDQGNEHSAMDDYAVVLEHLEAPYLTRLTADLPAGQLDQDLVLVASDGDDIGTLINVTSELNRAPDIVCPTVCTDPYGSGGTTGTGWRDGGRGDGLCTASPGRSGPLAAFGLLALAGVAFAFRRRR
ncbi:MAG: DUF2330 domain-containing protein [Sandaracinaceae bacterium]